MYLEKHIFAIERAVKDRALSSESLLSRFADARNYLDLLLACFSESNPDMVPEITESPNTATPRVIAGDKGTRVPIILKPQPEEDQDGG